MVYIKYYSYYLWNWIVYLWKMFTHKINHDYVKIFFNFI